MSMTILEKRERLGELASRAQEIIASADKAGRDVSESELAEVSRLDKQSKLLEAEIEARVATDARRDRLSQSLGRKAEPNPIGVQASELLHPDRRREPLRNGGNRPRFRDPKSGEELLTILPGESLAATVRGSGVDPSNLFEALFSGDTDRGNRELAALGMQGSIDASGGFLLPVGVAASVFDAVRAAAVVTSQIPVVSMGTADVAFAKLDTDVGSQWLGERVQQTDRSPTFGRMTLRARTLRTMCDISEELLEDASNVGQAITSAIAASFASKLDAAVISGQSDGDAGSPAGLRVLSGLVDVASVGAPTFIDFSSAYYDCLTANPPPGAQIHAVMAPRTMKSLDQQLEATTNAFLAPPRSWENLMPLLTTGVSVIEGAGANESFAIVGPLGTCIIGLRSELRIHLSRDLDSADKYSRTITAAMRCDFGCPRPAFFQRLTGITA